jgi:hypothetical protein
MPTDFENVCLLGNLEVAFRGRQDRF